MFGLRDGGGWVGGCADTRAKKTLCTCNGPLIFGSLFKISFFPRGRFVWFWVCGWFGPGAQDDPLKRCAWGSTTSRLLHVLVRHSPKVGTKELSSREERDEAMQQAIHWPPLLVASRP